MTLTSRLVASPATEALSVVTSLRAARNATLSTSTAHHPDEQFNAMPLKLALFNLQKYVREEEFSVEFMMRGGVSDLVNLLTREETALSGNTLAVGLPFSAETVLTTSTHCKASEDCSNTRQLGRTSPMDSPTGFSGL